MGCGSSSTTVQNFKQPVDNYNHQRQSNTFAGQANDKHKEIKHTKKERSRDSSTSSSEESDVSIIKASRKTAEDSKHTTESTKSIYTNQTALPHHDDTLRILEVHDNQEENANIEKHSSHVIDVNNREILYVTDNKIESNVLNFDNNVIAVNQNNERNAKDNNGSNNNIEQINLLNDGVSFSNENAVNSKLILQENHERRAQEKESKRSQANYELTEEQTILKLGLGSLNIPEMNTSKSLPCYSIDDIIQHNTESGSKDWFKYGRNVYSFNKMLPIIQTRMDQYQSKILERTFNTSDLSRYPIYVARGHGVTRKELARVLAACIIAYSIDIDYDQYMLRMKQSVENLIEDMHNDALEYMPKTENISDYESQLNRWLSAYSLNLTKTNILNYTSNPNELPFPMPKEIMVDPSVLRKWTESWEKFDTDVPPEGCWKMLEDTKIELGDTHEEFSKLVSAGHEDDTLQPFDMKIDGNAAWIEFEIDLIKNDATTSEQKAVWDTRKKRTNLNNPQWMKTRREEIGKSLTLRHKWAPEKIIPYLSMADNLVSHWKMFQELCETEFVLPKQTLFDGSLKHIADYSETQLDAQGEQNRPIMEYMDSGLELDMPDK